MRRPLLFLTFVAVLWAGAARADTVLVLPFANQSSSSNLDWIGESVSQTIFEALASRGILVLDREDRQEIYRRLSIRPNARLTRASVIKVAEALDAAQVIHGEFEFTPAAQTQEPARSRGSLRIAAYTVDMKKMQKGAELSVAGTLEDLASLQARLAWQVLGYVAPELAPPLDVFLSERTAVRLDAIENYTRGLLAANPEQKHRYFTQAVRLDDRFPQPAFELGRLYWDNKEYRLAADWLSRLKPSAARYMEASFLLGLCRYYLGDFTGAQTAFGIVAQAVPLNEVFNNLGAAESRRNLPDALGNFEKALEGDPADPDYHFNVGYALWKRGELERAAQSFRAVLDRNPEDAEATTMLGRCIKSIGPRPAGRAAEGLERLKTNYEEGAYRQLKAALASKPAK